MVQNTVPGHPKGGPVDEHALVELIEQSLVKSIRQVRFVATSIKSATGHELLQSLEVQFSALVTILSKGCGHPYASVLTVLQNKQSNEGTAWELVEQAVTWTLNALRILHKEYQVPTADLVIDISQAWERLAKNGLAFAKNQSQGMVIDIAVVDEPSLLPSNNEEHHLHMIVPKEIGVDVLKEALQALFSVEVIDVVQTEINVIVTLKSAEQVAAVPNAFKIRKHEVKTRKAPRWVQLKVPLSMTELDAKKMCLYNADVEPVNIKIEAGILSVCVYAEDEEQLKSTDLHFSGQKLGVVEVKETDNYFILYFEQPMKSAEYFGGIWEHEFEFDIVEKLVISTDKGSALLKLTASEKAAVLAKGINSLKKVTIAPFSAHRVRLVLPSGGNIPAIRASLLKVLPPNIGLFFAGNSCYAHATDAAAKHALLSMTILRLDLATQLTSTTSTTTTTTATSQDSQAPQTPQTPQSLQELQASQASQESQDSREKASQFSTAPGAANTSTTSLKSQQQPTTVFMLSPIPPEINSYHIFDALKTAGARTTFVFVRDDKGYALVTNDALNNRTSLKISNNEVAVACFTGEVPYLYLVAEPAHPKMSKDLLKFFDKVRLGNIEFANNLAKIPVPTADILVVENFMLISQVNNCIEIREHRATIGNTKVKFRLANTPIETPEDKNFSKVDSYSRTAISYLQRKRRDEIRQIKKEFMVKIKFELGFKEAKNRTNNNTNNNNRTPTKKEKRKDRKRAVQGNDASQQSGITFTGLKENVMNASEQVANILSTKKSDQVNLRFKDESIIEVFDSKVVALFEEASKEDVLYNFLKPQPLVRVVLLFGDQTAKDNLKSSIQSLESDLRSETLDLASVDRAIVSALPLAEIEREYEVKLVLDSNTLRLKMVGTSDAVTAAIRQLRSAIENTHVMATMKCSPLQFAYVHKYYFPALHASEGDAIAVEPALHLFVLKGKSEVLRRLQETMQQILMGIKETKVTKHVSANLVTPLDNYLGQNIPVQAVYSCKVAQEGDNDEDDGDDVSDTSSTTSTSSAPPTPTIPSTPSTSTKAKVNKYETEITIAICHSISHQKAVDDILAPIKRFHDVIKYEDPNVGKRVRFSHAERTHNVSVYVDSRKQLVHINAFTKKSMDDAKQAIKSILDNVAKSLVISRDVSVSNHFVMNFLQHKRKVYLQEMQQQYSLQAVTVEYPRAGKGHNVNLKGTTARTAQAEEDLKQLLQAVWEESIEIPFKSEKLANQLLKEIQQIRKEIEDDRDVILMYNKHKSGITATLVGVSNDAEWSQLRQMIVSMNDSPYVYTPTDFKQLFSLVQKMRLFETYVSDYNLRSIFFNTNKSVVEISARNPADIQAVISAIESLLKSEAIVAHTFHVGPPVLRVLSHPSTTYTSLLEKIKKSHSIEIVYKPAFQIRGTSVNVQNAKAAIDVALQEISSNIYNATLSMPVYVASEFIKDNMKLQKEMFEQTGVWLEFPEENNTVVATLKVQQSLMEVVAGNIVDEPTDCIVNAANELLVHSGGVAAVIAGKCGSQLEDECKAIIVKQGKIVAGNCVVTGSGALSATTSIQKVIHAVGPIWGGGNEEKLLEAVISKTLQAAVTHNCKSISIPAISSGIFGYPKAQCTEVLVRSVLSFINNSQNKLLHVRFCDKDKEILDLLAHHLVKQGKLLGTVSATSAPSNLDLAYQWSWQEDGGSFVAFDADQNYQIEIAYVKQQHTGTIVVQGDLNKVKNNFQYEVNFDNMTEINTTSRRVYRKIKREEKPLNKYITWQLEQSGQWGSFDKLTSEQIELAYSRKSSTISVNFQDMKLMVNFSTMRATTAPSFFKNSVSHAIRRHDSYEEDLLQSIRKSQSSGTPVSFSWNNDKKDIRASFTCLKEQKDSGVDFYSKKVQDLTCKEQVDMGNTTVTPAISDELSQIAHKFGVDVNTHKQTIHISGLIRPVSQALKAVMELLRSLSTTAYDKPPDSWTPQLDYSSAALIDVSPGSAEWKSIETRMKNTLQTVKIIQIRRIQNMWQWQKYSFLRDRLASRSTNSPEILLFHGTRGNNPSLIYNGDDGFDMRFSNQGMWGRASYFAVNASYSHRYAFTTSSNKLQMFSARVSIGKSIVVTPKGDLVKPPDGYDTVSGTTGDSVVYMVYENGRAYPEHLITYEV